MFPYRWVFPILQLGNKRKIEVDDILSMLPHNDLNGLEQILEKYRQSQISRYFSQCLIYQYLKENGKLKISAETHQQLKNAKPQVCQMPCFDPLGKDTFFMVFYTSLWSASSSNK